MKIRDKVVVVTGGASGIGAALCRRFAQEGARGIVIADRDLDGARAVASEVGGLALATDVGVESEVQRLVAGSLERYGRIDLFCSNAGVALGGGVAALESGPFCPDADWQQSWSVNVMAQVYATRAVLPAMLERGEGALLITASAAGLLTDLGTQAYSVTKHAALAYAEWLAIRYGDAGIQVACLCPMGVRTPMVEQAIEGGVAGHLMPGLIEPEAVADAVLAGLDDERFLILPHPEVAEYAKRRGEDPERWIGGMRRLRRQLYGDG